MSKDKNRFGGGNPNSLYVPMSDDEQEVLDRLVSANDLEIHIVGWGFISSPKVKFGDKRVSIPFRLSFNAPDNLVDVHYFDLELRTHSGLVIYSERQPTIYNNQPIQVGAGITLDMVWDIAISHMNPHLVKMIKPGAKGLTSRMQDRDTGDMTLQGNMHLSTEDQKALLQLKKGETLVKKLDAEKLAKANKRAKQDAAVREMNKKIMVGPK
jgi:hypothetical protein